MSAAALVTDTAIAFDRLNDECAGIVKVDVVLPSDIPTLFDRERQGDTEAARLAALTESAIQRLIAGRTGFICGACQAPIGGQDFSFAFAQAAHRVGVGAHWLGQLICTDCATTHETVLAKAIDSLRLVWPDLRPIEIANVEGHA